MSLDQLLVQLKSGGCFPSTKKPIVVEDWCPCFGKSLFWQYF